VGSREEGVDIYMFQEIPVIDGERTVDMEGYDSVDGVGGYLQGGEGAVVCIKVHERWEGKWRVVVRERARIGLVFELGGGRSLEVWNVYVGAGKHRGYGWVEGDRNGVVMGDINARHERWGGDEEVGDVAGRMVVEWMDEWGWKVGTLRGVKTRRDMREGVEERVLDVGFYVGGVEVEGKVWDWVVGLDHRPVEMVVKVIGWRVNKEEEKRDKVDWMKVEAGLRGRKEEGEKLWEEVRTRESLELMVEKFEEVLKGEVEGNRGSRKWKRGRKKWWNEEVEEAYRRCREKEEEFFSWGGRGRKVEVGRARKIYKEVVERVKREHWVGYLEELGLDKGYQWVKTDRDFVVDIPGIRGKDGEVVEDDEGKGWAIIKGLGKREKEEQEREGFWSRVEVEEEEVEELLGKQKDRKAAGENGLGGKVLKVAWKVGWCRRIMMEIVRGSLGLGFVCRRWRRSVGIIMRKPKKPDYSLPSSYRVINLLDVLGKLVERLVARRLERWGQEGMGDEQYGGRFGRSSLDGVGKLMKRWEEGGKKGALLCMDVMGGYENVGVNKCVKRLREVGVEEYLVKWVSSFLRERVVRVRVGKRLGREVEMEGGTVQGSPLSPILFMFVLGGVLEEIRKEKVEGVSVVACVDDVDFMVVGRSEEEVVERVRKMEVGLVRGLEKWEVDVQKLKLEGMWMVKSGWGRDRGIRWLGEDIRMRMEVRVLGVWFASDGGWIDHVRNRMRLAEGRWNMMLKLFGRGGRGMDVLKLKRIWKMVVCQCLMYGMEVYWDGQEGMRKMLQVWMNRHMRRMLGGVRSTPVDAMLGELGEKRVEYELDRRVERWGIRLLRYGKGEDYGETWRRLEVDGGVYVGGWVGRMMRGIRRHKLEGERWEVEKEREGVVGWKIVVIGDKKSARERWEIGREEREREWLVGVSDASGEGVGMGVGGGLWENGKEIMGWGVCGGRGLTVEMGEMYGVKKVLEKVEGCYVGEGRRKLLIGVDNVGVLRKLGRGRGFCGEIEQGVRRIGLRLIEKGWEIKLMWVAGHVGIMENEEVDERAKEGCWEDEEEDVGNVLGWSKWEQRRKDMERRKWKEYWRDKRKGEEYFGCGGGGERGYGGRRWEGRFMLWMRTNHGRMGGMRYIGEEGERCECGEREDRDHFLLYCKKWEVERKEAWLGWWGGYLWNEGWVDMERMLFEEEGVKRCLNFAKLVGWEKRRWKSWVGSGREERRGWIMRPRVEGGGGWLMERSEKRRREVREAAKLRAKKSREKSAREDSDGTKRRRKERRAETDKLRREELKKGLRKVKKRGERVEKENMSVRDMLVGVDRKREGRNILGEIVNGIEKGDVNVVHGTSSLRAVLPIASNTSFNDEVHE